MAAQQEVRFEASDGLLINFSQCEALRLRIKRTQQGRDEALKALTAVPGWWVRNRHMHGTPVLCRAALCCAVLC